MGTHISGLRKTSELLPVASLTLRTPGQARITIHSFGMHEKKCDSENLRNTIYFAFMRVGEGNTGIQYTIYIV